MLSIFEQKEFERQPEKKLTFNRLQDVLGPQHPVKEEQPVAVVAGGLSRPKPAAVSAPSVERKAAQPQAEGPSRPVVSASVSASAPAPQKDSGLPIELQEFADQFTRGFREVLVTTVKDIQAPLDEDRRKMDTAFDSFTKTVREVEGLRDELAGARQQVDMLAKAMQELSQRQGKTEDTVNITTAAAHAIQDSQQAVEKRLDLQAGVIRTLHTALQAREEKLDKLLSSFQALQVAGTERNSTRGLPENL
jgi:exonuclease VII small subunit